MMTFVFLLNVFCDFYCKNHVVVFARHNILHIKKKYVFTFFISFYLFCLLVSLCVRSQLQLQLHALCCAVQD